MLFCVNKNFQDFPKKFGNEMLVQQKNFFKEVNYVKSIVLHSNGSGACQEP